MTEKITVETIVNAPAEKVWKYWNQPEHITKWAFASDDWYAPYAVNDIKTGGKFKTTMAAKDGSFRFDFEGIYSNVIEHSLIEYTIADGRTVQIAFCKEGSSTKVIENFDAENTHATEMQRGGWQAILDNFKKHTEAN